MRASMRIPPPPDAAGRSGLCECGCGGKTTIPTVTNRANGRYRGVPMRYISGHRSRMQEPRETDRRWTDAGGYILLHRPDHPHADCRGNVREHRMVWEQANGRLLRPDEQVHHIDGNRQNNDPSNLVALTKSDHLRLHNESEETARRRSEAHRRRYADPEQRRKTSEAMKRWWAQRKAR